MGKEEKPLQNAYVLGQLLPIRIHDYITNILIHKRNKNDRGLLDVLDQWSMDVSSYTGDKSDEIEKSLERAEKTIGNGYQTNKFREYTRTAEKLLHKACDEAGLKASNVEAQQIIDFEKELEAFREKTPN